MLGPHNPRDEKALALSILLSPSAKKNAGPTVGAIS